MKERLYTEPKLNPAQPTPQDISKDWYIWFRYFNQSKNKWQMQIFKRGINYHKTFEERLKQAEKLRDALSKELKEGWNPLKKKDSSPGAIVRDIRPETLVDALDRITKTQTALDDETKHNYRSVLKPLIAWLATMNISQIAAEDFSTELANQYLDNTIAERGWNPSSIKQYVTITRVFFNEMKRRKWITENPFADRKVPKVPVGRAMAFSLNERKALKNLLYMQDRGLYYFTQFMYHTFIRGKELLRIKVGDVDLVNNSIIIRDSKNGWQEHVTINENFREIIAEMQLEKYPSDYFIFGKVGRTNRARIAPSPTKYSSKAIDAKHTLFRRELKINDKTIYSWKHSGVCDYYEATKDPYAIMTQCRHRSLDVTMRYLRSLGLSQNEAIRTAKVG